MPIGVEILTPARFAGNTVEVNPRTARAAAQSIAARSGRQGPVMTVDDVLGHLFTRYGMVHAVDLIREVRQD